MSENESTITRRQLLITAVASGATFAAGAWGATQVVGLTTRAQSEIELAKLRTLLALHEQLEKVGLDALLTTGMNLLRAPLDALKAGVRLLRDGIVAIEAALKNFQATLDTLKSAANSATTILDDLAKKFRDAEAFVGGALGVVKPLADTILNFFNSLLDKIPFGIGAEIRRAINALVDLIRAIPAAIPALTTQLLTPLRDLFFPATGKATVQTNLLDPLHQTLLEPLKKTLTDAETLLSKWENDFTQPIQNALDERQRIRAQIAEFKRQNGMA